jgi:hypothetical protein
MEKMKMAKKKARALSVDMGETCIRHLLNQPDHNRFAPPAQSPKRQFQRCLPA